MRTMVMEPSDVDTDAEVFRPAVVKGIARDPEVGLWHGYALLLWFAGMASHRSPARPLGSTFIERKSPFLWL